MNGWHRHKGQLGRLFVGFIAFGVTLLTADGIYLYRQRQAVETEIKLRHQTECLEMESVVCLETKKLEYDMESLGYQETISASLSELDLSQSEVIWNGKTYKRNHYIKAILFIGVDRTNAMTEVKALGEAGQADVIFLLCRDTVRNTLKILMLPRDTMTEIMEYRPDGSLKGTRFDHLSLAYAYGDGKDKSCRNVSEAVSNLFFGLPVDSYLATDAAIISQLNDAVGGVTVTIPTDGMEQVDASFVKGNRITLMGEQAEKFVRFRDINVDHSAIYRMNQQKEYLTKFYEALQKKTKENRQIVSQLFEMIEDYMVTDMAKGDYMKIALDFVTDSGIQYEDFYMVPGTSITTEQFDEYYADKEAAAQLLLELFYREI